MTELTDAQKQAALLDLVGDGKKYKSVEELAVAYLNADQFIDTLKRENTEQREELQTRLSVEDQLKMFTERTPVQPNEPAVQNPPAITPPAEAPTPNDDLGAKIREALEAEKTKDRVTANINAVTAKMLETYGDEDKANEAVTRKAAELGVSVEFLQSVAAQSPQAFFTQFGLDAQPRQAAAPRNEINTAALANVNSGQIKEGTRAYYDKMRKEDPKRYFTGPTQNQIMKDMTRLGDAFYT